VAEIRTNDHVCVIGLTTWGSATLLSYDLFMTIVLTSLFVWPLWTSNVSKPVRKIASRTLIASVAALMTSCANVAILTGVHGRQLGWLCLSSCGTDVIINALVVWWVTRPPIPRRLSKPGATTTATTPGALPPQGTTTTISISPSGRCISIHVSTTRRSTPSQSKTYSLDRQVGPTTSSKITFAEGPSTDDEAAPSYTLENKGSGMLDTILEAWKVAGAVQDGSVSLQVTVMTEEEERLPEDEERDIADVESGATALGNPREKPDR